MKKKQREQISSVKRAKKIEADSLKCELLIDGTPCSFEIDTGSSESFVSEANWSRLGKPNLHPVTTTFLSASGHKLPVKGQFYAKCLWGSTQCDRSKFIVTATPDLNLLGRQLINQLGILSFSPSTAVESVNHLTSLSSLQKACSDLCNQFPDLFKEELGCLKGVELDIKFKDSAKPVFCKPRPVPFSMASELSLAYQKGIERGVWEKCQFNDYGTPVVPVKKKNQSIRVCGDYSVTVNAQLEAHRQPIPLPQDLMRKLGGGFGFTKIDLADAYNQIPTKAVNLNWL